MDEATENPPQASVILVASEGPRSIGRVMDCLKAQTVSDRLEMVLAGRADAVNELRQIPDSDFHSIRVVEADLSTSARARTAAIRCSTGPILLFCEDHSFPIGCHWAERIIEAHRSSHAAVGPVVRNANPATLTSWANLVIEYGPWLHAKQAAEVDTLPGHNSSYKRDVLLGYDNALADMLEAEWVLHRDLRRQGQTLWIDPDIEVAHVNFSKFGEAMRLRLLGGWMFAASRAADWGLPRRLAYAASFPAIAVVRFARLSRQFLACPEAAPHALRSLPVSFLHLVVDATGEGIGYAFGDCGKRPALGQLEYHRWRNVQKDERQITLHP